jgi:alpha-D-ribose 1-methylphosphonate 5-triphosphate synthase subunit PhnH
MPSTAQYGPADRVFADQKVFRTLLDAMARPGRIAEWSGGASGVAGVYGGTMDILRLLADADTPVWLDATADDSAVRRALAFDCGATVTGNPVAAAFAVIADPAAMPAPDRFAQGTPEYPDASTTMIVQVERLRAGAGVTLAGPGIDGSQAFDAAPLPAGFWSWVDANHRAFPLGVDIVFVAPDAIAGLPRSIRVVKGGEG